MTCYEHLPFGNELKDASLSKIDKSGKTAELLKKWCNDPKYFLFFHGSVGVGKSYFCSAFYNFLKENKKECLVLSEYYFFNEIKNEINDSGRKIRKICETDFIIFEDMCSTPMNEWKKEIIFEFIDCRDQSCLPTLITSHLHEFDILDIFGKKIHSRIFAARNTIIHYSGDDRRKERGD